MRWLGHAAHVQESCMQVSGGKPVGDGHLVELGVDGTVILK